MIKVVVADSRAIAIRTLAWMFLPIQEVSEGIDTDLRFALVAQVPYLPAVEEFSKEDEMQLVRVRSSIWCAVLVLSMLLLGASSALAQEASPAAEVESGHPVHIHSGTCDALGEVVYPLTDTASYDISRAFTFGPSATPEAESEATPLPGMSVTQTVPVQFSVTHLDVEVVDLVAGGFAINAHESAENISNYIACGNIPPCTAAACAAVTGVVIDLVPQNNSGYFGVAQIDTDPEGGSIVTVFIFHPVPATSG